MVAFLGRAHPAQGKSKGLYMLRQELFSHSCLSCDTADVRPCSCSGAVFTPHTVTVTTTVDSQSLKYFCTKENSARHSYSRLS